MTIPSFSLRSKVFASIFLTSLVAITGVVMLLFMGMRDGYSRYLLDAELNRFGLLVEALAEKHDPNAPGWPEFRNEPHIWKDYVRQNWQSGPAEGPIGQAEDNPPTVGGGDGLQIGQRIFLMDADRNPVIVGRDYGGEFALRPISNPENDAVLGWLGMSIAKNGDGIADAFYLKTQIGNLAWGAGVAGVISFIAALVLSRSLLQPILRLSEGAQVLADGNYTKRIALDRSDELGELIEHYNRLAAVLEQKTMAERTWISDTSHELQTPLAVLRAQIEAMQDHIRPVDDTTLNQLHGTVQRLSRLVQDLKVLAFDQEGQLVVKRDQTSVTDVVKSAVVAIETRMAQSRLTVQLDADTEISLSADATRLRQVLDNLLENALRYTACDGHVHVSATATSKTCQIIIEDSAPRPELEDLPRLLDRFYRPDNARTRATGGSGLGLSISRAIIEAHGGTIVVEASKLGGLKIICNLPLTDQSNG